ncbi:MAG TPA: hypothetical protein H9779_01900 [Candidatus Alistipes avicola]|uniref:Uncharacterized protein n=1 Tax=Candidatus Alistipes avicola TaxID=2838432 RepID=A0A9D2IBE6_9BACT|nr:hypothetical protein [uncultured Alistipes sp.]HJA98339.1 hypothetical protein [Candidatus Alistipes avicola]
MQTILKPYDAPSLEQLSVVIEQGFITSDPTSTLNETITETDLNATSEDFWG